LVARKTIVTGVPIAGAELGVGSLAAVAQSAPCVATVQGMLSGASDQGIHRFLGIPYACPPIGALRWSPPLPPLRWKGLRDATAFGPACLQGMAPGLNLRADSESEDCLYLNVWTADANAGARQPVMVWIHGGGNLYGAGSEEVFDGASLAAKGVTVVTINYRLGAFGFLADPAFGSNFAVQDHVAALGWVRANIAGFGGNPDNVTVFGQSAGAVAVRSLLQCPQAKGLFHRAIIQSAGFEAPAGGNWWSYQRVNAASQRLFDMLGSHDPAVLRAAPAASVLQAARALSGAIDRPGYARTPAQLVWTQVSDGHTVKADEFPGWGQQVPVMLGTVENEGRFFVPPGREYGRKMLENTVAEFAGERTGEVLAQFDARALTPWQGLDELITTVIFTEPAMATMHLLAEKGRPLFYYHFRRLAPGAARTQELVRHTAELRYVFGTYSADGFYDATDHRIGDAMQDSWVAFARDGVPASGGAHWPRYDAKTPTAAIISDTIVPGAFPVTALMRLFNSMRGRDQRTA
jgi:para-nitrobenzyl esterase